MRTHQSCFRTHSSVGERVYKEKISFEDADEIIMNGMGTQFDPRLENCYKNARPRFEAYYSAPQQ